MKRNYPLWQRIFGPRVTALDAVRISLKASREGWETWLGYEASMQADPRKFRWLLAGLRDGYIVATVFKNDLEDVFNDPDPFELD